MSRYFTNVVIALLAGLVVVGTQAFAAPTVAWLAFGIAVGVLATSSVAQLDRSRGLVQRIFDGAMAITATVLIVFSLVFTGTLVTWLAFALALGFVAIALAGTTWHEIETWLSTRQTGEVRHLSTARRPVEAEVQAPATLSEAA
jgi:hypothetical protein